MQKELKRRDLLSNVAAIGKDVGGDEPDAATAPPDTLDIPPASGLKSIENVAEVPAVKLPRADFCRAAIPQDCWPKSVHLSNLPASLGTDAALLKCLRAVLPAPARADLKQVTTEKRQGWAAHAFLLFARAQDCDAALRALDGAVLVPDTEPVLATFVAPCKAQKKPAPALGVSMPHRGRTTGGSARSGGRNRFAHAGRGRMGRPGEGHRGSSHGPRNDAMPGGGGSNMPGPPAGPGGFRDGGGRGGTCCSHSHLQSRSVRRCSHIYAVSLSKERRVYPTVDGM